MTPLGIYLYRLSVTNADIFYKTRISQARLSQLRNEDSSVLKAKELYLIALAVNEKPWKLADEIYKGIRLNNELFVEQMPEKPTKFGCFLELKSRTQKSIHLKTGISLNRLSILSNDLEAELRAEELYKVIWAMEVNAEECWSFLFRDIKLSTPEEQADLKIKESRKRKMDDNDALMD